MALRYESTVTVDADTDLVTAAQRAPAAFAPLYRRYVGPVYAYCARRLRDRARAEDATSTVFEHALAALPRFDPSRGTFRSWLFTIAHNVIVSELRAGRVSAPLEIAIANAAPDDGPEKLVIASEQRDELRDLLARLPPDQREVLELRLIGLKGAEIAAVLGRSHVAVKVAQHRAIKQLRATLLDEQGER